MKFNRVYSVEGKPVRDQIEWKLFDARIGSPGKADVFAQDGVEAPASWSQTAVNVLAQKYFRKAGVPKDITFTCDFTCDDVMPSFLCPSRQAQGYFSCGGETSAHQVFHRLAGSWTYWAWKSKLVTEDSQARIMYDELYMMLAKQVAAPNSPQWFNTGLWWAYGIEGGDSGQWITDDNGVAMPSKNTYERPQAAACFIQTVGDSLVDPGGMMDLWTREARLFKHGSGSGSNMSAIRGKGEKLSGGGKSSGVMSFLRVGDRSAGAIKSGGTTRRAALLRILNMDHPDIEDFIWWKVREEGKAAAMAVGSQVMRDVLKDGSNPAYINKIGMPQAILDRAKEGIEIPELDIGWEGEAVETVSGQNSNNSVRIKDDFFDKVDADEPWELTARTTGQAVKTLPARKLWGDVCLAAWASADPGVQFDTTINEWNTCPNDGTINGANPCAEFNFLDGNACNLSSLRLTAFLRADGTLDLDAYEHACRIWTVVLDVSVTMASYPSKDIAETNWKYRTLGLGYADLGGLLMRLGLPYDSDEGRALAGALTALMTGISYKTSAEMAEEIGPFPRWEANKEPMDIVIGKHVKALNQIDVQHDYVVRIYTKAMKAWQGAVERPNGFRNAQTTLLPPTGTIGLVMDCDTLGIEPEFSLIKNKLLSGGGSIKTVCQAVPMALKRLGVHKDYINSALKYIEHHGSLEHNSVLANSEDVLAVFDCAVPPEGSVRCVSPEAHVKMVAAVQPFLSGAVSKTINLPRNATVKDVDYVYRLAHKLKVKAVALYRDGCKLTQPLSASAGTKAHDVETTSQEKPVEEMILEYWKKNPILSFNEAKEILENDPEPRKELKHPLKRGKPEFLPWRRTNGFTQKVKIGGKKLYLRVSEYPDGRPGELFLTLANEGSTLRAMADMLAMAVSIGLQHGVPVKEYADKFRNTRFEPAGMVEGHDNIKAASSIGDYLGRELALTYLGDEGAGQVRGGEAENKASPSKINIHEAITDGTATSEICIVCGNMSMRRSGSCLVCTLCGANTGCG